MPRIPEGRHHRPVTADPEGLAPVERGGGDVHTERPRGHFVDGADQPRHTPGNANNLSGGSSLAQAPGLLNGSVELPAAGRQHPSVRVVQAGLTTLAQRHGQADLNPGRVDGQWGPKTRNAVAAFQTQNGLEASGIMDRGTAVALQRALQDGNSNGLGLRLQPTISVESPSAGPKPTGKNMVEASNMLVEKFANNYGVPDPWYNLDPNHALPAKVSLGGLKGKWKCNLFGGNAMYAAGFEPPYYGNRGSGEYPNANQFFKWSDKYAAKYGNKVHFDLVGEVQIKGLDEEAKKAKIDAVLAKAEPGDMILVDHLGDDVADGGHTRVVITNDWAESGSLTAAQASRGDARVRSHSLHAFTGEETLWVLRPNQPRDED